MPAPIKLLIFDLDGTLVDSAPDIIATVNALMAARGRAALPPELIRASIGEGLKSLVYGIFPESRTDAVFLEELEAEFLAYYEANLLRHTRVFPGVVDFLRGWNGAISIVTNKNERLARETVAGLEIGEFDWIEIFGADSLSARKPDPLPLIESMRLAGVSNKQTLMIGDGLPDMRAARRAGVHPLAIEFGYADISLLKAAGASLSVPSFARLNEVIAQAERLAPLEPEPKWQTQGLHSST